MSRISHRKAVFLDKDDTIMWDVPGSARAEHIAWVPEAFRSLARMQRAGYALVVVTNQPGIADGAFTEEDIRRYLDHMTLVLALKGIRLADALYCPHHPEAALERYRTTCVCRKPQPGLINKAAERLGIDLERSWMIGDLLSDVEAGSRAGCRTVLLTVHDDQVPAASGHRCPTFVASTLGVATDRILAVMEAAS